MTTQPSPDASAVAPGRAAAPASAFSIRPIATLEYDRWADLFRGYLEFYKASLPQDQYRLTWQRLTQSDGDPQGLAAIDPDGQPLGIVHWVSHVHGWRPERVIYLEDLFTHPQARGRGVARALIQAVYAAADAAGTPSVYWLTQHYNQQARHLYDQIAVLTDFLMYTRPEPTAAPTLPADPLASPLAGLDSDTPLSDARPEAAARGFAIQPIATLGFETWARLWHGYLAFYNTTLPESQYRLTWSRLTESTGDPHGLAAIGDDGEALGIVHYLYHASTWKAEPSCYLQDLFTVPEARGRGIGRALIHAVYRAADAAGAPGVYWMTQHFNHQARHLYDQVATLSDFVKYARP